MKYRILGKTGLKISEVGFGAWGIGGPAMAGEVPIGWGEVNDENSKAAIKKAFELGINFFDTADFYGLGHSEELLAEVLKPNWNDVVIASKVGHQLNDDGSVKLNYEKKYIIDACERSLKRLQKEVIDVYQLHSAKLIHLQQGECIEAMEKLVKDGKIRYWGISLNTFKPGEEAKFFIDNNIGHTFQLVFNIINQRSLQEVIPLASKYNYGIIARMPLQFGLLTGKFTSETRFQKNDHRMFRLPPELLVKSLEKLEPVWDLADKYNINKTSLAVSFILSHYEISTVIPGIKTVKQAVENTAGIIKLNDEDINYLHNYFNEELSALVDLYETAG